MESLDALAGTTFDTAAAMETTADTRNWSELPEDILLTAMSSMEVLDVVRSSAVCSSWRSTYATFCRLRLPSPKQSPCLLYPRGPDGAALYSPTANASVRVRIPHDAVVLAGSAHGWLFATDPAANPYLLNPLTGAQAVLPPVTTFQCVVGTSLDDQGSIVYHIDDASLASSDEDRIISVKSQVARSWMYRQVALSAGGNESSCVVLVVHEGAMELHFARPGDKRWSSLASVGTGFISALYNDQDGLFYALQCCGTVHAIDLHGQTTSPTARVLMGTRELAAQSRCLAVTPCGQVMLVARTYLLSESLDIYERRNAFSVYKLDFSAKKMVKLEGTGDHALFLGDKSSAVCVQIMEDWPRLKPNCAYLADFTRRLKPNCAYQEVIKRRDIAIYWDFGSADMHNIGNVWPLHLLHLPDTAPAPIWITPSPF
jgi:hypothetical protein